MGWLALTRDDLVRRAVIMALMCQGELLFEPMEQSWLMLEDEARRLTPEEADAYRRHEG